MPISVPHSFKRTYDRKKTKERRRLIRNRSTQTALCLWTTHKCLNQCGLSPWETRLSLVSTPTTQPQSNTKLCRFRTNNRTERRPGRLIHHSNKRTPVNQSTQKQSKRPKNQIQTLTKFRPKRLRNPNLIKLTNFKRNLALLITKKIRKINRFQDQN